MKAAFFLAAAVVVALTSSAVALDFTQQTQMVGLRKNMETTLYVPKGPGPYPTILVMHTSGGISEADRGYCANLAREGYICTAPAFLRAHGINSPELRRKAFTTDARAILDDFRSIVQEMQAMPQARKGAACVVGFSNGGYFAAMIASGGRVKAAVSYYGTFTGANTDPTMSRMSERWNAQSSPLLILAGEGDPPSVPRRHASSRPSSRRWARRTSSRCTPARGTTSTASVRLVPATPRPLPTPGSARSPSCVRTAASCR